MPFMRLTKRAIEALPLLPVGQELYRDDEFRGFGIRIGTRSKGFFVEGQIRQRTKRLNIGRFPLMSVEAARSVAHEYLAAMSKGINPVAEAKAAKAKMLTVDEAFTAFFLAKPNLAKVTTSNYKRTPTLYLKGWLKTPLNEVSRDDVLSMHRQIAQKHGAVTANNAMRHFRAIYNFVGSVHDNYPKNPVDVLTRTRSWAPERRRRTLVASHQLAAWWKATMQEGPDARDFLWTCLLTGMRRNEVARLEWANIDLIGKTLYVPRTKNGDSLTLPMSEFLCNLISSRRELVGQSPYVFPGPGKTGHLVEVKKFLQRVGSRAEVRFTVHDLRRTFITIAESLDIPAYALKKLLNHRGYVDMTESYVVVGAERLRAPMERITQRILELVRYQNDASDTEARLEIEQMAD